MDYFDSQARQLINQPIEQLDKITTLMNKFSKIRLLNEKSPHFIVDEKYFVKLTLNVFSPSLFHKDEISQTDSKNARYEVFLSRLLPEDRHLIPFVSAYEIPKLIIPRLAENRPFGWTGEKLERWNKEVQIYENLYKIFSEEHGLDADYDRSIINPRLNVLVTQYIEGSITLYNLSPESKFSHPKFNASELKMTLFQIYYILWKLHSLGVRHNDLHSNNVLLQPNTSELVYRIFEKNYRLRPQYLVKIFDFDLSTLTDVHPGLVNDYQEANGDFVYCTNPNSKYDLFTITSAILELWGKEKGFEDLMQEIRKNVTNPPLNRFDYYEFFKTRWVEKDVWDTEMMKVIRIETPTEVRIPNSGEIRNFEEIIRETSFFEEYRF